MNKLQTQSLRGKPQADAAGKGHPHRLKIVSGIIVVLVVAVVGLSVWAFNQNGVQSPTTQPIADVVHAEISTTGSAVGQIAPDFSIGTLEGDTFSLSEHQGKPTVMLFMAYWCGTCLGEARALTQLHQEYGDQLNIISIDVDPSSASELLAQFKEAAGNGDFIWAFDTGQKVTAAYQVAALDTTLVIDPQGQVVYRDKYSTSYQQLKDELGKLGF